MATIIEYITDISQHTWSAFTDGNPITVESIGGGGGGGLGYAGIGGGGGGYAKSVVSYAPDAVISIDIGEAGIGSASNNNYGSDGTSTSWNDGLGNVVKGFYGYGAGGGGSAIGDITYSGGSGGNNNGTAYPTGGGGAGSQFGNGKNGGENIDFNSGGSGGGGAGGGTDGITSVNDSGGNGGDGHLSTGHGNGGTITTPANGGADGGGGGGGYIGQAGADGGPGTEYEYEFGAGGGGGGSGLGANGGNAGKYGAGGGGAQGLTGQHGGNGAQGIMIITYEEGVPTTTTTTTTTTPAPTTTTTTTTPGPTTTTPPPMIPLTIYRQPETQAMRVGNTATFDIGVTGSGSIAYQWYEDGSGISGANSDTYTTPILTTSNNNEEFTCYVDDGVTGMLSDIAYLYVVESTGCTGAYGNGRYAISYYKICGDTGAPASCMGLHEQALRKIFPIKGMADVL